MKYGILLGEFMKTMPLREAVLAAKRIRYSCVELPACDPGGKGEQYERESAEELCDWIRGLGLDVSAFQCHFHRGFGSAEASRFVDHVCRMMEIGQGVGVPVVHTVSGIDSAFDPLQNRQVYDPAKGMAGDDWKRMVESYRAILERTRDLETTLAIEPVFVYLVCNAETTCRLLEEAGSDQLFINFDPSHFPFHDEDAAELARLLGQRIVHCHAKDASVTPVDADRLAARETWPMKDERQFAFAPPGKGVLDWPELYAALDETGFDGVMSLEMGHGYVGEPKEIAAGVLEFLRRTEAEKHE